MFKLLNIFWIYLLFFGYATDKKLYPILYQNYFSTAQIVKTTISQPCW